MLRTYKKSINLEDIAIKIILAVSTAVITFEYLRSIQSVTGITL